MANQGVKFLTVTFYLCLIISIFALFLSSMIMIDNSKYQSLQKLGENWNKGLITSISAKGNTCSMGEVPIIDDEWPGTVAGCDCGKSLTFSADLSVGYCSRSKNSSQKYCTDISPLDPVAFTKWGYNLICGRRSQVNYFDLNIVSSNEKCPKGTKQCAIVDSLNNKLCMDEANICPINKLIIQNKEAPAPKDFIYSIVPLENGKILYYTNQNINGQLIHEFTVSDGQPCVDNLYYNTNSTPYLLSPMYGYSKCDTLSDGIKFDERKVLVDSESKYEIYDMNGILGYTKRLPYFKQPIPNEMTNIYETSYFGMSTQCKSNIIEANSNDPSLFITGMTNIEPEVNSAYKFTKIAFIVSCVCLVFTIVFYCIVTCCSDKVEGIFIVFFFIIGLIMLIFSSISAKKVNGLSGEYKLLSEPGCLDVYSTALVSDFNKNYPKARVIAIAGSIMSGILLLLPLVFLFLGFNKDGDISKEPNFNNNDKPSDEIVVNNYNNPYPTTDVEYAPSPAYEEERTHIVNNNQNIINNAGENTNKFVYE